MVLKQVQSHRSLSERGSSRQRTAEAVWWQEQIRWPQNDKEWIFPLSLQIKESCLHFDCSFVMLAFTFWPPASVKQLISIVFTTNCVIHCTSKEKWMQTIMANSSIKLISVRKCSVYKKNLHSARCVGMQLWPQCWKVKDKQIPRTASNLVYLTSFTPVRDSTFSQKKRSIHQRLFLASTYMRSHGYTYLNTHGCTCVHEQKSYQNSNKLRNCHTCFGTPETWKCI